MSDPTSQPSEDLKPLVPSPVINCWTTFPMVQGDHLHCELGPLDLHVLHRSNELKVYWRSSLDHRSTHVAMKHQRQPAWVDDLLDPPHEAGETVFRYAIAQNKVSLSLRPHLPNRPIVARLSEPLWVHGHRAIEIFVSNPLWIELYEAQTLLSMAHIPSLPLSDSWFGSSPREGELCYANRTEARLDVHKIPLNLMRATTRITVVNQLEEPVRVERVKIPSALLGLHINQKSQLWTTSLRLERRALQGKSKVQLGAPKATSQDPFHLITPPAFLTGATIIERAFHKLIG
jgi:hypothetical protein